MKEQLSSMEQKLKQANADLLQKTESLESLEKSHHTTTVEMVKMRARIIKLKKRRNVNIDEKICKLCGSEYLDKENFNWVCRTHTSKWTDTMWWCCGKNNFDA
jgi:DNA repair exonuclease SbcCD ATPase subunit